MDWFEEEEKKWGEFLKRFEAWKIYDFSGFCLNTCDKHCCDLSHMELLLTLEELGVILGQDPPAPSLYKTWKKDVYCWHEGYCPQYEPDRYFCRIWNDPRRPAMCKEYPFGASHDDMFREKDLYVSPACVFKPGLALWAELENLAKEFGVQVVKVKASGS
jgi:hypothetical protein